MHLAKIAMSREVFESLPLMTGDAPSDAWRKRLIDGLWHAVGPQGSSQPIEICTFVSED